MEYNRAREYGKTQARRIVDELDKWAQEADDSYMVWHRRHRAYEAVRELRESLSEVLRKPRLQESSWISKCSDGYAAVFQAGFGHHRNEDRVHGGTRLPRVGNRGFSHRLAYPEGAMQFVIQLAKGFGEYLDERHDEIEAELTDEHRCIVTAINIAKSKLDDCPDIDDPIMAEIASNASGGHVRSASIINAAPKDRVYLLLCKGAVVYVGMTSVVWPKRIAGHKDKEFDQVYCLEVEGDARAVERSLIFHFKPKYNKEIPYMN